MVIHVAADYGHGDLAFAEVAQRLCLHLPEATLVLTPTKPEKGPVRAATSVRREGLRGQWGKTSVRRDG